MKYNFHTEPVGPITLPSGKWICGMLPWEKYTKAKYKKIMKLYKADLKIKEKNKPEECFEEIEVVSNSDKSKKYIVTLKDGMYSCECKGFTFRKICTHIETVKKAKEKGQ